MHGGNSMKNLAVIPARQGSKGIAYKNIKLLCGKPLIVYSIEAAKKSNMFDNIFVSTDSEYYAEIAREAGANVPFLRSVELSGDTASSWDVAREAVRKYRERGMEFDTVALLQPTSPLRKPEDIIAGYNKFREMGANLVVSVCEEHHSPLWSNTLPEDHSLANFIDHDLAKLPRQSLPKYYRINGALYIVKTESLMKLDNLYSCKSYAYIMSKENSIDIDDNLDFVLTENIINTLRMQR
jgi:CMP-N,N'-diacetyllegionaminic acid synthase